jgi:hypothetical protein
LEIFFLIAMMKACAGSAMVNAIAEW